MSGGITGSGRVNPERVIGGIRYRCAALRGDDMIDAMVIALRALSPLASEEAVGAMLAGGNPVQAAGASLGGSISAVLRELKREDVHALRRLFAAVTEVEINGGWLPLDRIFGEHFAGRPAEILQWLLHAFSVSFPLFFLASVPSPAPGQAAEATAPQSPNTSTGSAGGR